MQTHDLQAAQEKRLNLGVELYGFQQQLAQLQKTCQEAESKAAQLAAEREVEEPILVEMREQAAKNAKALMAQKAEVRVHLKRADLQSSAYWDHTLPGRGPLMAGLHAVCSVHNSKSKI